MAKWRCIICGCAQTAMDVTTTSERMKSPRSPLDRAAKPLLARGVGGSAASATMPSHGPPTREKMAPTSMSIPTSMTTPCMASV